MRRGDPCDEGSRLTVVRGPFDGKNGAVLDVWLAPPGGQPAHPRLRAKALVDTGADFTYIHPAAASQLGLQAVRTVHVRQDPGSGVRPIFRCLLDLGALGAFDWTVTASHPKLRAFDLLLGRDLLMRWVARFDGPKGEFEVTEP